MMTAGLRDDVIRLYELVGLLDLLDLFDLRLHLYKRICQNCLHKVRYLKAVVRLRS